MQFSFFDLSICFLFFFKQIMSGNGTVLCPFERRCRGQLWEVSPWTDKSSELSLCLSHCSNLECIIKGKVSGRVSESVFLKSYKSCEFMSPWLWDLTSPFWFPLALSPRSHGLSFWSSAEDLACWLCGSQSCCWSSQTVELTKALGRWTLPSPLLSNGVGGDLAIMLLARMRCGAIEGLWWTAGCQEGEYAINGIAHFLK